MYLVRYSMPLVAALFLAACGGSRPLIKEDMANVHTVAIVGVYSAKQLRLLGGNNPGPIGSLRAMKNLTQGKNLDGDLPIELINYARDVYPRELAKVKGWRIVPYSRYLNSPQYKKVYADYVAKTRSSTRWMTGAQGMEGVIDRRGKNAELFRSFATALGVDAVAIVQMDMSYGASGVAVNGFGKARGHVGTGITLVRKDGKVLIESGNPMNTSARRAAMSEPASRSCARTARC
jgi:hypothetical protein